jgi:serine/threonine protein kinase
MATHYCARCLTSFPEDPEACPNLTCGKPRPQKGGWGVVLGPGDLLDRHYLITRPLAVGGAGITYLAREVDGSGAEMGPELAIKLLYAARASGPFLRRLSNEAQILQELDHDHIVKCHGFVHRAGHEPYLVTLLEHGGSLAEHIETVGPVPPAIAAAILKQILLALDTAHQRGVVHRDLKPDNVLLREKTPRDQVPWIRVTDFGIAKVEGGVGAKVTKAGSFVGTPEYAAPEQFESQPPVPATDIFAAGGVLFYLLTGNPPVNFSHRNDIESAYDELLAQIPPQLPDLGSPADREILQDCLDHAMKPNVQDRWTVAQLIARLAEVIGASEALNRGPIASGARAIQRTVELTAKGAPTRQTMPGTLTPTNSTGTGERAAEPMPVPIPAVAPPPGPSKAAAPPPPPGGPPPPPPAPGANTSGPPPAPGGPPPTPGGPQAGGPPPPPDGLDASPPPPPLGAPAGRRGPQGPASSSSRVTAPPPAPLYGPKATLQGAAAKGATPRASAQGATRRPRPRPRAPPTAPRRLRRPPSPPPQGAASRGSSRGWA